MELKEMDQVGRERKNDGRISKRKRESGWTNLIYDKERRQSIIAAPSQREWEISAAIKKDLLFCLRVRVIYMQKKKP